MENLKTVRNKNNTFSFVLSDGTKLKEEYKGIKKLENGMAIVALGAYTEAIVNKNGQRINNEEYRHVDGFSDGFSAVLLDNGKWTYVDTKGTQCFGEFKKAYNFNKGFAVVELDNDKYVLINTKGERCSQEYVRMESYKNLDSFKKVKLENGNYGVINTSGEHCFVESKKLIGENYISDKYMICELENDQDILVDINGKTVLEKDGAKLRFITDENYKIHDNYINVKIGNSWALYDIKTNKQISKNYTSEIIKNGNCYIAKNKEGQYILDGNGKEIAGPFYIIYTSAETVDSKFHYEGLNLMFCSEKPSSGLQVYDKNGNKLQMPEIFNLGTLVSDFLPIKVKSGKFMILNNKTGELVSNKEFSNIQIEPSVNSEDYNNNLVLVTIDGNKKIMNAKGEIVKGDYSVHTLYNKGTDNSKAIVRLKNGNLAFMNMKGDLISSEYQSISEEIFTDGYIAKIDSEKYVFLNSETLKPTTITYKEINSIMGGFLIVKNNNNKYEILNSTTGENVIKGEYDKIYEAFEGEDKGHSFVSVALNNEYLVKDFYGKIAFKSKSPCQLVKGTNLVKVGEYDLWSDKEVYNMFTEQMYPFVDVERFVANDNFLVGILRNRKGVVIDGETYMPVLKGEYDMIGDISKDGRYFAVYNGSNSYVVNKEGKKCGTELVDKDFIRDFDDNRFFAEYFIEDMVCDTPKVLRQFPVEMYNETIRQKLVKGAKRIATNRVQKNYEKATLKEKIQIEKDVTNFCSEVKNLLLEKDLERDEYLKSKNYEITKAKTEQQVINNINNFEF